MLPSVIVETRTGRTQIPRSRRLVVDILRLHQRNPTVAHSRSMRLGEVADARSRSSIRISWSALFIKAWAEVSSRHPVTLSSGKPGEAGPGDTFSSTENLSSI